MPNISFKNGSLFSERTNFVNCASVTQICCANYSPLLLNFSKTKIGISFSNAFLICWFLTAINSSSDWEKSIEQFINKRKAISKYFIKYIINFLIQNINIQDVDTITGHLNWILYLSAIRPGLCFPKKEKNYQQQQKIILKCSPLL